jgi:hypothetical protein
MNAREKSQIGIEVWKSIPGFANYKASNLGRVKSRTRKVWNGKVFFIKPGKVLSPKIRKDGRIEYKLEGNKMKFAHQLVLLAFDGEPKENQEARHYQTNDMSDNRLINLRYGTKKQNARDRIRHGTHQVGERNPNAKLSKDDVRFIRKHFGKWSAVELGTKFDIHSNTIYKIVNGNRW